MASAINLTNALQQSSPSTCEKTPKETESAIDELAPELWSEIISYLSPLETERISYLNHSLKANIIKGAALNEMGSINAFIEELERKYSGINIEKVSAENLNPDSLLKIEEAFSEVTLKIGNALDEHLFTENLEKLNIPFPHSIKRKLEVIKSICLFQRVIQPQWYRSITGEPRYSRWG